MTPTIRVGLILSLTMLLLAASQESALGQRIRVPVMRPPTITRPTTTGGFVSTRPNIGGSTISGGSAVGVGMGQPGFGGTSTVRTWHCPKCNREVGRGDRAPTFVTCCGQDYANGKTLGSRNPFAGMGGSSNPAPAPATGMAPAPGMAPATGMAPPANPNPRTPATGMNLGGVAGFDMMDPGAGQAPPSSFDTFGSTTTTTTRSPFSTGLAAGGAMAVVTGIGMGLVGLVIAGGSVLMLVQSQRGGSPSPRRRARG